jgi:hypothetical protein
MLYGLSVTALIDERRSKIEHNTRSTVIMETTINTHIVGAKDARLFSLFLYQFFSVKATSNIDVLEYSELGVD